MAMNMPIITCPVLKPYKHAATATAMLMVRVSLILRGPRAACSICPPSNGRTGMQFIIAQKMLT